VFGVGAATRIYLAPGATDMRKGFNGLYGLVRDQLLCDPLSGHLFLFSNAQRNRLKGIRQTNACWQLQIAGGPCGGRELWKSLDG